MSRAAILFCVGLLIFLIAALFVGYLILAAITIKTISNDIENKQLIDDMTEKIYKQEQQLSYYEKLLEANE